jgi:hypothetical protein
MGVRKSQLHCFGPKAIAILPDGGRKTGTKCSSEKVISLWTEQN